MGFSLPFCTGPWDFWKCKFPRAVPCGSTQPGVLLFLAFISTWTPFLFYNKLMVGIDQTKESWMDGLLNGIRSRWLDAPVSAQGWLCLARGTGVVEALGLRLHLAGCRWCGTVYIVLGRVSCSMLPSWPMPPGMDRLSLIFRYAYSFYHVLSSFANQEPYGLFKVSCPISTLTGCCFTLTHKRQY